jgi:hypothetical protein
VLNTRSRIFLREIELLARFATILALVFALAGALVLGTAQPANALAFINIDGHVYYPGGTQPAPGVCIILRAAPDQCLSTDRTTDAQGFWSVGQTFPIVGNQSIWYVLSGYVIGHDTIPGSQTTDYHGNFTLVANPGTPPPPVACTNAANPTSTNYLPNITRRLGGPNGWDTPFYVQNAGTTTATSIEASFYFFDTGGFATCHAHTNVVAGASVLDDPNLASDLLDGKQYSVVVRSYGSAAVAAVNQAQTTSSGALEALSYSGFNGGATTVYVPNVTRRFFGYDVPLIVQNLGVSSATVTATFTSFDGTQTVNIPLTVGAGRSGVIDPDFTSGLTDGTQYAVKLTSSQPIGVVANAHNEAIGPVAFSHNGLAAGAGSIYAPYATKSATSFSPVVVQNVGSSTTSATLTFTPLGGGAAQTFTVSNIPAGGAQAFDVRFPNGVALPNTPVCTVGSASCLAYGNYSLVITSPGLVAAVVLPNSNTTAAGYLAAVGPTSKSVLPVVQRNMSGWNDPIYLQSIGASSATLQYYVIGAGTLAATQTQPLTTGTGMKIDPATVAGLADGQQYAVVITGNGALTAIVDELNPATGDGTMIYEGFAR